MKIVYNKQSEILDKLIELIEPFITANDVTKLSNVASNVQKTAKGNYLVVIDDKWREI